MELGFTKEEVSRVLREVFENFKFRSSLYHLETTVLPENMYIMNWSALKPLLMMWLEEIGEDDQSTKQAPTNHSVLTDDQRLSEQQQQKQWYGSYNSVDVIFFSFSQSMSF
jgi:hypothetical protein